MLQAQRLLPDAGDELTERVLFHFPAALQQAVGEKPDRGKGRLQLVRGVRDEAAAHRLRALEAFGETVELMSQRADLIVSAYGVAAVIVPVRSDAHGALQLPQAARDQDDGAGSKHQRKGADRKGENAQAALYRPDALGALRVELLKIQDALRRAAAGERDRDGAEEA